MTVIPKIMKKPLLLGKTARFALALAAAALLPSCAQAQVQPARDTLRAGWESTPDSTKPHLYWYWLNGIVTQSGISRDLELMAKNGIGGAYIGQLGFAGAAPDTPQNSTVEALSPEWYETMQHAVREGQRTGVGIGVFNSPGWSQSGGPWVKPEDAMMRIESVETRVAGGQKFDAVLPRVDKAILDVRVIAFPVPPADGQALAVQSVASPDAELAALADGKVHALPEKKNYQPLRATFEFAAPQTVQSLAFEHRSGAQVRGVLSVSSDGVTFAPLREFMLDRRSGPGSQVQTNDASVVAIAPTTARFFRVEMPWNTGANGTRLGLTFSGAARLESFDEKQLSIASRDITPPWDAFLWPASPEPAAATVVAPASVLDLTKRTAADGRLQWNVPPGDWIIQRFSTVSTGARNSPASAALTGWEIDKMSRAAAARHINEGMIGELWRRLKPEERGGFLYAIADSYEKGPQNWTPELETQFRARYGYDAVPFLPVLGGRVVGSATQSDRFLWDLRRLVADLVAVNYVGGLRDAVRPLGLKLWLEPYGHYGFPAEFASYGGQADGIGGEFWSNKPISHVELRDAASAAHTYGKNIVSAEAFTSAGSQLEKPGGLKTRGDMAFADGINHYVLHVTSHQPTDVPGPGLELLWGTYFNRNSLWYAEHGRAWVDYVRRSSFLLQQGNPVADVAYFIGEDTPQMTGLAQPALPKGYDFDWINAEVLLTRATVKNRRLTLPDGTSYSVLVLPPLPTMRPQLLERIAQLVNDGLTVVGPAPTRSPSLQDFPRADERVRQLVAQLWPQPNQKKRQVGQGAVWNSAPLQEVLASLNVGPAIIENNASVLWKQRSTPDAEIFFLSNQTNRVLPLAPSFRVTGRAPQLWNAETTRIETLATYRESAGRTVVPLVLQPAQAVFVVFRREAATPQPVVVELSRDGKSELNWTENVPNAEQVSADSNLVQSFWIKPQGEITLPAQSVKGVALSGQRWVILPPRGDKVSAPGFQSSGPDFSIGGISVGRNGVVVLQHWAGNAPAVLVWKAPAPITDWTHVTVAYRAGVPTLYVDGRAVQTGVRTGQKLLAGDDSTAEGSETGSLYATQIEDLQTSWGDMSDVQIAALAEHRPELPTARVVNVVGALHLQTRRAGDYTLRLQNGRTLTQKVAAPLPDKLLDSAWNLEFRGAAAPPAQQWNVLKSWSEAADDATKYFSGSAVYRTTFTLPANYDRARTPCELDLGEVGDVARVSVNGREVGTTLRAPYVLDIGSALQPGANQLEVLVTSNWANRMIGDEQFPDDLADSRAANGNLNRWPDWAFTGAPRPEPRRVTLSARRFYSKNSSLQPSGLMGPVTLRFAQDVVVRASSD